MNLLSVGSGIGLAALAPLLVSPAVAWPAAFAASFVYLLLTGAELAAADVLEAKVTGEDPR